MGLTAYQTKQNKRLPNLKIQQQKHHQMKQQKIEKNGQHITELLNNFKRPNIHITGFSKEEEKKEEEGVQKNILRK